MALVPDARGLVQCLTSLLLQWVYMCAAASTGGNTVIPDHTLKKAAIEQFLTGGLTLEAIQYQVLPYTVVILI
jgi:hypothetical protein